jgi:ABC-2 type transport system ATP-binding protein
MSVIEIDKLTRVYGSRRGVQDVTMRVGEGEVLGFLGPNGAGKTTTIRVLLGFLRPSSGRASVFGLDAWRDSARIKRDVGALPGDVRLWTWLTGTDALSIFSSIRSKDIRPEGKRLAEIFDLNLSVKVRKMSRGMRQKLGIILALAHKPKVLILDEPTTALDPLMQARLRDLLRECAKQGSTVFFSSHTLAEVEDLCERVAIVKDGQIVADTTLTVLKRDAGHDVMVKWRGPVHEEPIAGLSLTVRTPTHWAGTFHGDVAALTRALARHEHTDVRIARPDLETLFHRFYTPTDGARAGSGT